MFYFQDLTVYILVITYIPIQLNAFFILDMTIEWPIELIYMQVELSTGPLALLHLQGQIICIQ